MAVIPGLPLTCDRSSEHAPDSSSKGIAKLRVEPDPDRLRRVQSASIGPSEQSMPEEIVDACRYRARAAGKQHRE